MARVTALPAELLLITGELVCWEVKTGWDALRLVSFAQSCRHIYSTIRPLLGSSVPDTYALTRASHSTWVRAVTIDNVVCRCCRPQWTAGFPPNGSISIEPHLQRLAKRLVHLHFRVVCSDTLSRIVKYVAVFPHLRFLHLGEGYCTTIHSVTKFLACFPHLDTLVLGGLLSDIFRSTSTDTVVKPAQHAHRLPLLHFSLDSASRICESEFYHPWLDGLQPLLANADSLVFQNASYGWLKMLLSRTSAARRISADFSALYYVDKMPASLELLQVGYPGFTDQILPVGYSALTYETAMLDASDALLRLGRGKFNGVIQLMWDSTGFKSEYEDEDASFLDTCRTLGIPVILGRHGSLEDAYSVLDVSDHDRL